MTTEEPISNKVIFIVAGIAFFISLLSLILSYSVFTSTAHDIEFGKLYFNVPKTPVGAVDKGSDVALVINLVRTTPDDSIIERRNVGWIIDLIRFLIMLAFAAYLMGVAFVQETRIILTGGCRIKGSGYNVTWVRIIQVLGVVLVILLIILLLRHHWIEGPKELQAKWVRDAPELGFEVPSNTDAEAYDSLYFRPYRWYLAYSIINYIFIGLPMFLIGTFAAVVDFGKLKAKCRELNDTMKEANTTGLIIRRSFDEFCHSFIEAFGRYSWLLFALVSVVCYENWIGRFVLSTPGQTWAGAIYILFSLTIILLFFFFLYYENAFRSTARRLIELKAADVEEFEEKYCVIQVLRRILRWYLVLSVAIFLLLASTPISDLITKFK